jgi:hypothetical protein
MGFDERQKATILDFSRSSFAYEPPGHNAASRRLDQIEQAVAEALHEQRMRQSCADMADLIEHAKAGEFREPSE